MTIARQPSLRHLRIFESVAKLESISDASADIHLTQPAVTQAIANLEKLMGVALFERRRDGSYLTPNGKIFASRVDRLFSLVDDALRAFGLERDTYKTAVANRISRTHIRCLAALADRASFAEAAAALEISGAALRRSIRGLEEIIGAPLCHRTTAGLAIGEAGRALASWLSLAMGEIDSAFDDIQAANGVMAGRLSIGAMRLDGSFELALVLNELSEKFPNASIRVVNGSYEEVVARLRSGAVDLSVGLLRDSGPHDEISQEALSRYRFEVVARVDHPLARLSRPKLSDLARYDWVLPAPHSTRRDAFERLFKDVAQPPKVAIETASRNMLRAVLADSDRLSLLSHYEILSEARLGLLRPIHFPQFEPLHIVGVMTRRNWRPTPVQAAFLELIRSHAGREGADPSASAAPVFDDQDDARELTLSQAS